MSSELNKLFVIYIGGKHAKGLIELHDMRFVVAPTIEETYPSLRESWWGTPKSLHIDAWGALEHADGFDIEVSAVPPTDNTFKLYFINLGGYDSAQFTELHKNVFVVARNDAEAKAKSLEQIRDWDSPHRDNLHAVESVVNVDEILAAESFYLHLRENASLRPFEFTCKYKALGKV